MTISCRIRVLSGVLGALPTIAVANGGLDFDFYGSLRMQAEAVRPDNRQAMRAYTGLRDAYSRIGLRAEFTGDSGPTVFGELEVPFDTANFRRRDPYDQGGFGRSEGERVRVARVGLRGALGTLSYGQQWMPYYNVISATVDRFSTYYSGFATYTVGRFRNTLAYSSPEFHGFGFSVSYTDDHGNRRSTSRIDDRRIQAAVSYGFGSSRVSMAVDDRGSGAGYHDRFYGLSASHSVGNLYFGAKYEITDTNDPNAFYGDRAEAYNLFADYTRGKNTYKLMVARVENYGEEILHIGLDHRFNPKLTLFAEYYQERETAAITGRRQGLSGFDRAVGGGRVFATGLRYDF